MRSFRLTFIILNLTLLLSGCGAGMPLDPLGATLPSLVAQPAAPNDEAPIVISGGVLTRLPAVGIVAPPTPAPVTFSGLTN